MSIIFQFSIVAVFNSLISEITILISLNQQLSRRFILEEKQKKEVHFVDGFDFAKLQKRPISLNCLGIQFHILSQPLPASFLLSTTLQKSKLTVTFLIESSTDGSVPG